MLIGIPPVLSPGLMKTMMEMGHGDEIILTDGNFPATYLPPRVIRADGMGIVPLLDAILGFFPLEYLTDTPIALMALPDGFGSEPPIWEEYRRVVNKSNRGKAGFEQMERYAFYERARAAYVTVATGETRRFANIILRKGVVQNHDWSL